MRKICRALVLCMLLLAAFDTTIAGLIAAAGWSVISISLLDLPGWQADGQLLTLLNWRCLLVAAAVLVLTRIKPTKKLHPVLWILLSAGAGVLFQL